MLKKLQLRKRRHNKIRKIISAGTALRPRIVVYRSNTLTHVNVVNDEIGTVLTSASTRGLKGTPVEKSKLLGTTFAETLLNLKIQEIVFDRNGFRYHGRVKSLAEGLREGGIKF